MEHVSTVLARAMAGIKRPELPPLEPNAYLAWRWAQANPEAVPMTVVEYAILCGIAPAEAHRQLVGQAAQARRDARLARHGIAVDYPSGEDFSRWLYPGDW
jgi:hypothetical protein